MCKERKYGKIQTQVSTFSNNVDTLPIVSRTRSYTFYNAGANDVELEINGSILPIFNGKSITFGGYDDMLRTDNIKIKFVGAGAKKLVMLRDIILQESNYISE